MRGTRQTPQCRAGYAAPAILLAVLLCSVGAGSQPVLQDRVDGHRPLRGNPQPETPAPTVPGLFEGYPGAPEFSVVPRRSELQFYPCENCHGVIPPNAQRRQLYSPHPAALNHGSGRIWCLDCHALENRNTLESLAGENVDFNDAYLICGQCHFQPQKDWYFGAHGKRQVNWQGERTLYNCTHCHDPHQPAVRPRPPEPPPPVRRGLERRPAVEHAAHSMQEQPDEPAAD